MEERVVQHCKCQTDGAMTDEDRIDIDQFDMTYFQFFEIYCVFFLGFYL